MNKSDVDSQRKNRDAPSILSSDLKITGELVTQGEIQIDGTVEGNVRANSVTVGESANIMGEIACETVTIRGRIKGTLRAHQVHLCANCHVDGDIYHKILAVENGAHFNGTVKLEDNPLANAAIKEAQDTAKKPNK